MKQMSIQYIQKIRDERFVVGLVYIDNYEDALESVDDVRRSTFCRTSR